MSWLDFSPALTEIILALGALGLLLVGAIRSKVASNLVYYGAMAIIGVAAIALLQGPDDTQVLFGGLFTADPLAGYLKILLLLGSFATLAMSRDYVWRKLEGKFEYPLLILLATLGACVMASASDLLTLYVGLELQSLSLYVLAALRRDHAKSSEAGLKYFILGALSSGALLYGASLIYGFVGTTNFAQLASALHDSAYLTPPVIVGMVFVLAGLAFKISAAPFHMWTPDVYAGAPTSVTALFRCRTEDRGHGPAAARIVRAVQRCNRSLDAHSAGDGTALDGGGGVRGPEAA